MDDVCGRWLVLLFEFFPTQYFRTTCTTSGSDRVGCSVYQSTFPASRNASQLRNNIGPQAVVIVL